MACPMPITRHIYPLPCNITCIDSGLFRPGLVSCYVLRHAAGAAIIETGTTITAPILLRALAHLEIARQEVDYIIPTHVHLDHAGGAGALMQACSSAMLVIHPRGKRHMIDPAQLWRGAVQVYGEDLLQRLYGMPVAVDESRIIVADDGFVLHLGDRDLEFVDTPGHARHHFSVFDTLSRGFFTGDTFGMAYPELAGTDGPFIIPATTPVQFDPDAWHKSLDRYQQYAPERMFLTHFSMVEDVQRLQQQLRAGIDSYAELALGCRDRDQRGTRITEQLLQMTLANLRAAGCPLPEAACRGMLAMDMDLNSKGLECWLNSMDC